MKYAVIENEEYARLSLCSMINDLRPDWKCVFTSESVEDTLEFLRSNREMPDLIFMDIELDDGNCFDIFRQMYVKIPVVFTTAYDSFALKAFDVNSLGYILKPLTPEKLSGLFVRLEGLERALHSAIGKGSVEERDEIPLSHGRILVSNRDSYLYIESSDIAFFTAEDKYVSVTLNTGVSHLTDFDTLANCMKVLDRSKFFQISRNTIVNIDAITKVSKFFKGRLNIELKAGSQSHIVVVSSARKTDFLRWLGHSH